MPVMASGCRAFVTTRGICLAVAVLLLIATLPCRSVAEQGSDNGNGHQRQRQEHHHHSNIDSESVLEYDAMEGHVSVVVVSRPDDCVTFDTGDTVKLRLVGRLAASGRVFTGNAQEELTYTLGTKTFVPGFDYALEGACVGEERTAVVPSRLAFGEHGRPPTIPPHADIKLHIKIDEIVSKATPHTPLVQRLLEHHALWWYATVIVLVAIILVALFGCGGISNAYREATTPSHRRNKQEQPRPSSSSSTSNDAATASAGRTQRARRRVSRLED